MPTTTTNYSLLKPLVNNATDQDLWGGYLNDDMDDIDGLLRVGIAVATQSSQTSNFAVDASISVKKLYPCDVTGGGITATLPAAATAGNGATVFIKKTDSGSNAVTIARTGSDTIDGGTSLTLSSQNAAYGLVSDGVDKWSTISRVGDGNVFKNVVLQTFTASGTYTPSAGMLYCIIELVGGGGGGGGGTGASGWGGGGGGAGGYSMKRATAAQIGVSQVVTIGAAGTGGASQTTGTNGGTTSVGSLASATGGSGGTSGSSTAPVLGGLGGATITGDVAIPGEPGGAGFTSLLTQSIGGQGGSSKFGSGGLSPVGAGAFSGNNAVGYGAGGSGGINTASGGNGTPGYVLITEYCSQ